MSSFARPGTAVVVDVVVSLSMVVVCTSWWHQLRIGGLIFGVLVGAALLWRRRRPVTVLAVVALLAALAAPVEIGGSMMSEGMLLLPMAVAMHAVIVHTGSLPLAAGCAAVTVVVAAALLRTRPPEGSVRRPVDLTILQNEILGLLMLAAVIWAAALTVRLLRERKVTAAERRDSADRERAQQTLVAVAEERARIARELHDIVAHSLSVIVLQAHGGRYALAHDPGRAAEALRTIGVTGSEALDEIRQLVLILRGDGDDDEEAGRDHAVGSVVDRARTAGVTVDLIVDGEPAELPGGIALAVYRIVQESLTNTLKHSGPEPAATVRVSYRSGSVEVQVTSKGAGGSAPGGGGHGLVGMRERATLYGGTFSAGPVLDGGWKVAARIPLDAGTVPT